MVELTFADLTLNVSPPRLTLENYGDWLRWQAEWDADRARGFWWEWMTPWERECGGTRTAGKLSTVEIAVSNTEY